MYVVNVVDKKSYFSFLQERQWKRMHGAHTAIFIMQL